MTRNDTEADDRYVEFQLDGKQVIIVLAGVLLLCAVSFHFGRRIGRAEAAAVGGGEVSALMGQAPGGESLRDENAAADLTFFDTVGRKDDSSKPPQVVSGADAETSGSARPDPGAEAAASRPEPAPVQAPASQSPPPSTARPPAAPVASVAGGFDLQVAAYSDRARAEALSARLAQKGYSTRVVAEPSGGRSLYKVRVGGFASRPEAEAAKARLEREEKLQPWIVAAGS